jgi:acyl-CoA thioesterase FadM
MARAVIILPEKFVFSTEIPVRITDINYGGHLGNDAMLSILQEARLRFLNSLGYSEKDIEGYGIIMADSVLIYKSQAYYGDVLKIEITANDFSKRACDLIYLMSHKNSGKEIARAKTRIAFFDYTNSTTVPIPAKFLKTFRSLNGVWKFK